MTQENQEALSLHKKDVEERIQFFSQFDSKSMQSEYFYDMTHILYDHSRFVNWIEYESLPTVALSDFLRAVNDIRIKEAGFMARDYDGNLSVYPQESYIKDNGKAFALGTTGLPYALNTLKEPGSIPMGDGTSAKYEVTPLPADIVVKNGSDVLTSTVSIFNQFADIALQDIKGLPPSIQPYIHFNVANLEPSDYRYIYQYLGGEIINKINIFVSSFMYLPSHLEIKSFGSNKKYEVEDLSQVLTNGNEHIVAKHQALYMASIGSQAIMNSVLFDEIDNFTKYKNINRFQTALSDLGAGYHSTFGPIDVALLETAYGFKNPYPGDTNFLFIPDANRTLPAVFKAMSDGKVVMIVEGPFRGTIHDPDGQNSFDFSHMYEGVRFNMNAGSHSFFESYVDVLFADGNPRNQYLHIAPNRMPNLFLSWRTKATTVIDSPYDDDLTGNDDDNIFIMRGGEKLDIIDGRGGNDTIVMENKASRVDFRNIESIVVMAQQDLKKAEFYTTKERNSERPVLLIAMPHKDKTMSVYAMLDWDIQSKITLKYEGKSKEVTAGSKLIKPVTKSIAEYLGIQ